MFHRPPHKLQKFISLLKSEYFTDALGNWQSRAKEVYRSTALQAAHARFCRILGSTKSDDD